METDPEDGNMETVEQESLEPIPIETNDEDSDGSDTEFVPLSNNGGLSRLPVRVRPS
jgi:hypothetical protein